jgi:hypothetical protein
VCQMSIRVLYVAAISRLAVYVIVQISYSVSNSTVYWVMQNCAGSRDVTVEWLM